MAREPILSQLVAIRLQLGALSAQVEASIAQLMQEPETPATQGCQHPRAERLNMTPFGGPEHWLCRACNLEYIEEKGA